MVITNIIGLLIIIPYYILTKDFAGCRFLIKKIIAYFVTKVMTDLEFWNISVIDKRLYKGKGPYILVCNHVSIVDTLFTVSLPFDDIVYTWKKKWSYVPGFGWLCLLANHITIDSTEKSKKEALIKSKTVIDKDSCVLFYAEGTRNLTGKGLLPFKTGAFRLAKEKEVEIIPITLIGTDRACSGFVCGTANIKIIIDNPIRIRDVEEGVLSVRKIIEANLINYSSLSEKMQSLSRDF
jgi:1-acyl-sn-glycerol-3-phosphate acyltransferase